MSKPTEKEQLNKILDLLLDLVVEGDHANFKDMKYPYVEIGEIVEYAWKKYLWLEELLKFKYGE